jgi:hypothetical protein
LPYPEYWAAIAVAMWRLALGAQTVGEIREVDLTAAGQPVVREELGEVVAEARLAYG